MNWNNRCHKRYKKLFNIFPVRDRHSFVFVNAFSTLDSITVWDVIKACSSCGFKEVVTMDRETLVETSKLFPNAFEPMLRDYIASWYDAH